MKIRKSYGSNGERTVYIHENKKEESILVAIPSLEWSCFFTYEEAGEELNRQIAESLSNRTVESEASELSSRIRGWTGEM
ncbi:YueH family protein [Jeotgalibacillus haloalkalitolerans]|uniref:YueH family protein n=1 Tax=Jeotgalibacillus haloalkalitolerans TaxID=3104292 RepID=A0ABU5KNX3_9BACL|nr:YueH family protein [Jeotgalibacillus sp. HH7-29]MDZ5712959.1 YueH family protein [Jeotgalibacillus sp. HH7-29]